MAEQASKPLRREPLSLARGTVGQKVGNSPISSITIFLLLGPRGRNIYEVCKQREVSLLFLTRRPGKGSGSRKVDYVRVVTEERKQSHSYVYNPRLTPDVS